MEFMPAVYSAIEAVAEGKVAEAEVEHRQYVGGGDEVLSVVVRKEVRQIRIHEDGS